MISAKTKTWLIAQIKQTSTQWGLAILVILGALFLTSDQIGEYTARLTAIAGLLGAYRLIAVQEAPKT